MKRAGILIKECDVLSSSLRLISIFLLLTAACHAQHTIPGGATIPAGAKVGTSPDVTPPTFSAFTCGTPGSTTATCTWTTNEPATTQLCYSADPNHAHDTCSTVDPVLVLSHAVSLSGLTPSTTYWYVDKGTDGAGNSGTSAEQTFATAASGGPSNPQCGNQTTGTLPPDNGYQSYVGSYTCNGTVCTVNTVGVHDLLTNHKVRLVGTSGIDTAKGGAEVVTKIDNDTFTFPKASSASGTTGFVVRIMAQNAGDTYVDPLGNCTVTRLGNFETTDALQAPGYANWRFTNPSNTLALALIGSGSWSGVYEIRNFPAWTQYRTPAQIFLGNAEQVRWLNDSEIVYFSGTSLWRRNIVTLSAAVELENFSAQCSTFAYPFPLGSTGDIDDARDVIAFSCAKPGGGSNSIRYVFSTDTYSVGAHTKSFAQLDSTHITPDGADYIVRWDVWGTAREEGIELFNGTTGAFIRQIVNGTAHGTTHRVGGINYMLLESEGYSIPAAACQGIVRVRLSDSAQNCAASIPAGASFSKNVSSTSSTGPNPGWFAFFLQRFSGSGQDYSSLVPSLPTSWPTDWQQYGNEILTAKSDGTALYRLAYSLTRTQNGGPTPIYERLPHCNITADGKFVVCRSSLGTCDGASPACARSDQTETLSLAVRP